MSATPNKYVGGRIYRIVCGDLTYIGSTCQQLSQRMGDHRRGFKRWTTDPSKYGNVSSFRLFEIGEPTIFLVEEFPCDTKEKLLARERHYIETTLCVNKIVPTRTKREYKQANADKIRESNREYQKANVDKIREYLQSNAEKITENKRAYYQLNIDNILEQKR